jgi:hypothetical protein
VTLVFLAVLAAGCSFETHGVDTYLVDRGLDLIDVIDFKLGAGLGLGAKLQASDYMGVGLGAGAYHPTVEAFGRRFFHNDQDGFLQGLVVGVDGTPIGTVNDATTVNILLLQLRGLDLPFIERFRFGGEILLPGVQVGLFVNVGEILDFIVGLATWDPALDDGMRKGADLFPAPVPPPPQEDRPPLPPPHLPAEEP